MTETIETSAARSEQHAPTTGGLRAVLIVIFAVSLILTSERRQLTTSWPWMGLTLAVLLLLPNLVWQVQHGWPSLHFFSSQNAKTASDTSRPAYVAEQLLFLGSTAGLAATGVVWLWRHRLPALALIPVLVTLVFLFERGRSYYPLPADALAVAAGAVAVERWLRRGWRMLLLGVAGALQIAVIALAGPIVVPFYTTPQLVHSSLWKVGYFKDEIGWQEMTTEVEQAWAKAASTDRADGVILAHNYGEASALQFFGRGLPVILSGHLSWQYWRPQRLPQRFALTVGYPVSALQVLCSSWKVMDHIENRWHLENEERGRIIAACNLRQPLGSDWNRLIASDQL